MRKNGSNKDDNIPVRIDARVDLSTHESIIGQYSGLLEATLASGGVEDKSFEQAMRLLKAARETVLEARQGAPAAATPLRAVSGGKTSSPF
jgi:hypothetical protein